MHNRQEVKKMLEDHLQTRPRPVTQCSTEFLGLRIKGGIFLELGPYTIQGDLDGCDKCVYYKRTLIWPEMADRYEPDDDIRDDFSEYSSDDQEDLDFTACSLDDCGYCGKCMY